MKYEIDSNTLLFEVDRTAIIDISIGDVVVAKGFNQGDYIWTEQDSQFVESNPDARLFLKVQRQHGNYQGIGIMVIPEENTQPQH